MSVELNAVADMPNEETPAAAENDQETRVVVKQKRSGKEKHTSEERERMTKVDAFFKEGAVPDKESDFVYQSGKTMVGIRASHVLIDYNTTMNIDIQEHGDEHQKAEVPHLYTHFPGNVVIGKELDGPLIDKALDKNGRRKLLDDKETPMASELAIDDAHGMYYLSPELQRAPAQGNPPQNREKNSSRPTETIQMSGRETIGRALLAKCLNTSSPLYILRWALGLDWYPSTGKMASPAPLTEPPVSRELAPEDWARWDAVKDNLQEEIDRRRDIFSGIGLVYPFETLGFVHESTGLPAVSRKEVNGNTEYVYATDGDVNGSHAPQPVIRFTLMPDSRDGMPRQFDTPKLDKSYLRAIPSGAVQGIQEAMRLWQVDEFFPHFMKLDTIRYKKQLDLASIRNELVSVSFKDELIISAPDFEDKYNAACKSVKEFSLGFPYSSNPVVVDKFRFLYNTHRTSACVPLTNTAFVHSFLSELAPSGDAQAKLGFEAILCRIHGESKAALGMVTEKGRAALPATVDAKLHADVVAENGRLKRRLDEADATVASLRKRNCNLSSRLNSNSACLTDSGSVKLTGYGSLWVHGPEKECSVFSVGPDGKHLPLGTGTGPIPIHILSSADTSSAPAFPTFETLSSMEED